MPYVPRGYQCVRTDDCTRFAIQHPSAAVRLTLSAGDDICEGPDGILTSYGRPLVDFLVDTSPETLYRVGGGATTQKSRGGGRGNGEKVQSTDMASPPLLSPTYARPTIRWGAVICGDDKK